MSRPALRTCAAMLTATGAAALGAAILAVSPAASATEAPTFTFPHLGTVVVSGTVDGDLNYTVYRITNPDCTGTDFPGVDNSCVPQQATDTLVIPQGTYDETSFELSDVPDCGPTQQDVYDGAYQPTVTADGTHHFLAGGIVQLDSCSTSPSPSPSSPSPTASSPAPTASSPASPRGSSAPPSTTTPSQVTATSSSSVDAIGSVVATTSSSSEIPTAAATYVAYSAAPSTLASTGAAHVTALSAAGLAAVAVGGLVLVSGRRRTSRGH